TDLSFQMLQPTWEFHRGVPNSLHRIRMLARCDLYTHLSVFAGLTINVYLQHQEDDRFLPPAWVNQHRVRDGRGGVSMYVWPGFSAGVRL
ncbi:MAG: hypothetical protein ABW352_10055, partial [Polyangiales bacterium]